MNTPQVVRGPFHHHDIFHIDASGLYEPPRARQLDAAGIARVAARQTEKKIAPVLQALDRISSTITNIDTKQRDARARVKAQRDAIAEMERYSQPPLNYVRDESTGEIRLRTTKDDATASYLHYGRDANGKRPGEPGYQFDGEAMLKAGASLNEINRAVWAQKR